MEGAEPLTSMKRGRRGLPLDVCAEPWLLGSSSWGFCTDELHLWALGSDASVICQATYTNVFRRSWEENAVPCSGLFTTRLTGRSRAGKFIKRGPSWRLRWPFPDLNSPHNARCQGPYCNLWRKPLDPNVPLPRHVPKEYPHQILKGRVK